MPQTAKSSARRADSGSSSSSGVGELEAGKAVRRSDSGQLSVSIGDVSKTESFRRDLKTLGRIRLLAKANPVGR
jgi:hypothetical protein